MSCLGRQSLRASTRIATGIVAAMLCALALLAGSAYAGTVTHPFVSSFDGSDSTAGAFGALGRIAVSDASGDSYVIDYAHSVVARFDSTGRAAPFTTLQLPAGSNVLDGSNTPDSSLALSANGDSDVAVDNSGTSSDGNVIVDSEPSNTVYAFDSSGNYLWQTGGFGDACGVAVDTSGNVWVSDFNATTVTQFTSAGSPTGAVINTSAVGNPCHLAIDSNDNLYVNMWQGVVEKYDSSGTDLGQVDGGPSFAVAVDRANDHVFVDHDTSITEYDSSGNLVGTFGSGTLGDAQGVAVDSSTGHPSSGHIVTSDNATSLVDIWDTVIQIIPDVTTGVASDVAPTTATLGGIINPNGASATCTFDWGTDTSYGSTAPCSPAPGSGTSDLSVHADLSGLTPGTTYHFRLSGTSADGTANGDDQTFTTPQAPGVGGGTATTGSTSATLKATVDPNGAPTTYRFEYGTDTSYGTSAPVPDASAGSSSSPQSVSVDVSGLQPSTTYHFRVVATNVAGTTNGPDHTFATQAAAAADACPNAQVRQQQGSSALPDCRAWELVSQADKGESNVLQVSPLSTDGNRVMYDILGGAPGTTNGARAKLIATRTANGWVSHGMLPPAAQLVGQTYLFGAAAADLSGYVASAFDGLGSQDESPNVTLVRLDDQGNQTVLHRFSQFFGPSGMYMATSNDLQHVYATVPDAIAPSQQPGTEDLYDFGSGAPTLVGTMPATGVAPTCGVPELDFVTGPVPATAHWTSTDGRYVFFQTQGDDAPSCSAPLQLYVHDMLTGRSTLVSGPPAGGDPDNGVDSFLQATPDGSVVYFRTATSYSAADDADGNSSDMDIYRWTASNGQLECITCAIPNADVLSSTAISDDGSHVYFSSLQQYDGAPAGATSSSPNSYVWQGGTVRFVAQTNGVSGDPQNGSAGGEVTPDGNTLVLTGNTADLDARSGSDNGGTMQYYRYDDRDRTITCVSCPQDGSPATADVPLSLTTDFAIKVRLGMVSDDGSTLAFVTSSALVPGDRNGQQDVYEWHDGHVSLLTSGTAPITDPSVVEVSPDGRDILFRDVAPYTADARDKSHKLYDARVDGGFAVSASQPPCSGDQCRGPLAGAPALADPATASTTGGGNVAPPARFSIAAITARQRALLVRTGRLALRVHVDRAGVASAVATARLGRHVHTVARASKRARRAGTLQLTLKLSKAARQRLAHGGKLRLTLVVRFSGASSGRRLTLTLVPATANGR